MSERRNNRAESNISSPTFHQRTFAISARGLAVVLESIAALARLSHMLVGLRRRLVSGPFDAIATHRDRN